MGRAALNAFESETWRWSCRACCPELKEKAAKPPLQPVRRVTLPKTGRRRTAAGHPDRSVKRRLCNKHCVPCWERDLPTVIFPSVELMATARAAAPHQADQQSATVIRRHKRHWGKWIGPVPNAFRHAGTHD